MIERLSERYTNYLLHTKQISGDDYEVYRFGISQLFFIIVNSLTIITIGILFGKIIEMLIFVIAFVMLRRYAGGYHAPTAFRCYLLTSVSAVLGIYIIKSLPVWKGEYFWLFVIAGMCIFCIAPVENSNKPLDAMEVLIYGTRAKVMWCVEALLFVGLYFVGCYRFALAILVAQLILVISLLVEKMRMRG